MSHKGTNWAIQQRGLKPATKLVLWYLADRHNPDLGCFPAQARLAEDCEMSRASLNQHLDILEKARLIHRIVRLDEKTKRQQSTRYILGFEADFPLDGQADPENPCPDNGHGSGDLFPEGSGDNSGGKPESEARAVSEKEAEPCPDSGPSRVQNLDTNPVREPGIEPEKKKSAGAKFEFSQAGWERLLRIAGHDPNVWVPAWWRGKSAESHVKGWMDAFGFTEAQVLEIAEDAREGRFEPLDGPIALDAAMRRAASGRKPRSASTGKPEPAPPASDDEVLRFHAEWINGTKHISQSLIRDSLVSRCIAAGLVTRERCIERGLRP